MNDRQKEREREKKREKIKRKGIGYIGVGEDKNEQGGGKER